MLVDELVDDLVAKDPETEGLTVSGGEPLQQADALAELIDVWKVRTGAGVIVLTGYQWDEVDGDPLRRVAISRADLVVAGRYNARLHVGSGLRGSGNKTYHFLTDRFLLADVLEIPEFEAVVGADGTVHVSGVAGSEALRDALGST